MLCVAISENSLCGDYCWDVCCKHFGQLFFKHIPTVSGYITGSITSHLSSRQPNKKSALGTWRLVEMLGASQVHRWIGIDQTYQTLDLDTRECVFECGLDADAEAQQNQRLQCFFKKRSAISQEGTTGDVDMTRAQRRHRVFF